MVNYNYHAAAKEIMLRLCNEGFTGWVQKLKDAIAGGATGTEIIMTLRWNLKKLMAAEKEISPETRALIRELITHLDAAIKIN